MHTYSNVEIISTNDFLDTKLEEIWYIIYIRKSTDEEWKQIQSLEDQLVSCYDYAEKNNLKLAKRENYYDFHDNLVELEVNKFTTKKAKEIYKSYYVILETWSAKIANKRAKWRKIIEYIKKWKIPWLLSYHPDRHTRNLLEAGELIELYDQRLVDLKYSTFEVQDTPAWKMILWILFVISKHFSEKLSLDVKRWIIGNLIKWKLKWNWKLYWYIINHDWTVEKDPEYAPLIKKAYDMKLKWKSNKTIINYLNKHWLNAKKREINWDIKEYPKKEITNNILNRILTNWIYAWFIDYEEKRVKKRIYLYKEDEIDFPVLISLKEFNKVQSIISGYRRNHDNKDDFNISPFYSWFFITEENKQCSFYIRSSSKKKYREVQDEVKPEYFFKNSDFYFKIQTNTDTYLKRKKQNYRTNFPYREIEKEIILPALWKIDADKAEEIIIKNSIEIINSYINKYSKENKSILGSINRYKWLLKEAEENNNLEKIEEYSIKLANLEDEKKIINEEIDRIISTYTEFKSNIQDIKQFYVNANPIKKKNILFILFDKLVIKDKYFILYTHSYFKYIFNISDEIVLKKIYK